MCESVCRRASLTARQATKSYATTPTAEETGYENPSEFSSPSACSFWTHSTLERLRKSQQGEEGWRDSPHARVLTFGLFHQVKSLILLKDFFFFFCCLFFIF